MPIRRALSSPAIPSALSWQDCDKHLRFHDRPNRPMARPIARKIIFELEIEQPVHVDAPMPPVRRGRCVRY
jgi:hypothetical protein